MLTKKTNKNLFILLLTCVFIMFILFTTAFGIQEFEHQCAEEHCPICWCIHQAELTLKQLSSGFLAFGGLLPLPFILLVSLLAMMPLLSCSTPVTQKVKMLN